MNNLHPSRWILIFLATLLAATLACAALGGDEPADVDATSTEIAAGIFATQTAEATPATDTPAPTSTSPPTDTPAPTDTPVPTDTPTDTPLPTDTPEPTPTDTPEPTNTPMPDVIVSAPSVNLRAGPGLDYPSVGSITEGDTAMVTGQAFDCGWLLVETAGGEEAWITGGAQYVTLNLDCADIAAATIPPTPTSAASPTPPASATPDRPTIEVIIENNTGEALFINLSGPATYGFTIQPGSHPIQVVPGTYTYTVTGCGGATDSGTIGLDAGLVWTWECT